MISTADLKDPTDPSLKNDPATKAWFAHMDKYLTEADKGNGNSVYGYVTAETMAHVLRQCGDNPSRENGEVISGEVGH